MLDQRLAALVSGAIAGHHDLQRPVGVQSAG